MKKYLFILIMPAIWNNLSAQLKTYSGEFEEGRATYTYKESSDGERIYHGKFSFDGGLNRSITGTYINGKKMVNGSIKIINTITNFNVLRLITTVF